MEKPDIEQVTFTASLSDGVKWMDLASKGPWAGQPAEPRKYQYAIGRNDSYASWKTNPALFTQVIDGLKSLLTDAFRHGKKPDLIVCHGSSGIFACAPLVPFLAEHGVSLFHLRKPGENAHGQAFEGPRMVRDPDEGLYDAWLIDDGIASGGTVRRVEELLKTYNVNLSTILLYADQWCGSGGTDARIVRRDFVGEAYA
jgi:hypothetical protein